MHNTDDTSLDNIFNEVTARTLKKYRLKAGMSLEEVVNKMKKPLSRQSLYKYENNQARIKNTTFIDICNALNLNPKNIYYEINEEVVKNAINFIKNNDDGYQLSFYDCFDEQEKINDNFTLDNAEPIYIDDDIIQIPIYGTIKAGIPIESQTDIIDYVEIPKSWMKGGKQFYGLKISGDSMFPKYQEDDIVIFEQNNDTSLYNGKDCAIMINGTESTFKKLLVNEQGIVLQPYNSAYDIMMFSKEQVENLPIKVVGIAKERRTKIN